MAATNDDVARLVVNLDATTTKFTNAMRRALAETNRTSKGVEDRLSKMNRNSAASFDALGRSVRIGLARPIAALTGVLGTREILKYADTWTEAGNRIAAAGSIVGLQGRSLEDIRKLADDSRSAFDPTVQLYSRILRSAGGVAQSELEIARATDIVNKAFKAGGAASSEMAAGILQLSQGLSSGVLQGDELRSVRENAPVLASAIADYFGVTIGGLKDLGSEGKLTSESVFKAILSGQGKIEAAFQTTNRTIGEGFTAVQNALIEYIGLSDKSMGVTGMLNQALLALANNFENVADIALKLASIIAGALIGKAIFKMVASLGLGAKAVTSLVSSLAALRAGAVVSGTAITSLSAAAGPLAALFGTGLFLGLQAVASEAGRVSVALSEISSTAASLGYASDENTGKLDETIKKVNELTEAEAKLLGQRATADRNLVLKGTPLSNFASIFTGGELNTVLQASDRFVGVLVETMSSKADREAATVANDLAMALIKGLEFNLADVNKTLSDLINMDGVSEDMKNSIREFFEVIKTLDQANYIATIHVDTSELDTALSNVEASFESLTSTAAFFDLPESIQNSIKDLTENFDGSLESVEALDIAINELAGTNSIFLNMANALNPFIDKAYAAFDAVNALNAASREARALAAAGVVDVSRSGRMGEDVANDPNKMFENTAKFVAEQRRVNSLTQEQLDIEKEIARIRKDQPNLALSESALTQLARDNLAAAQGRRDSAKSDKGGNKDADKFAENIANTEKEIELLGKEAAMLATLNPLAAGYTLELEKWRKEQELLTAAEEAGILLTPDLRAKISLLAQGYTEASDAVEQLKQSNEDARASMDDWFDLAKSSTRSFIDDLIEGKSAADALANALNQVGSYLINLGLDSLFGGSGGGLIGGLFGLPGRERGGPVSAGQPYVVGEKRAELFVPTQNGVIIPKVPSSISSNSSGSGGFVFSPVIDARGASPEAVARLEDVVRRQNADFEIMVKKIVMDRGRGKW